MAVGQIVQKKPDPCSFVIFGVTGDLAHRLVVPALYNLAASDLLPDKFCLVGVARKGMTSDRLRDSLMKGLSQFATREVDDAIAQRLLGCLTCIEADPKDPASFDAMNKQLGELEAARNTGGNRLFYLATPPNAFLPISRELGRTGMLAENGAWRRLVVEKPFGTDLASAKALNANGMFEPIWNRNHIDHVQITVDEQLGVGHRGSFYDQTGALRDMVPNHLFQLLSLVAMEPPIRFDAHSVRAEKADVLAAIQPQSEAEALRNSVRGQYLAGRIGDSQIEDYRKIEDVAPDSTTETYAALNYLVIGVAPNEGIALQFNTKVPGPSILIDGVEMKFRYKDYFKAEPSTGYETLIYDCMIGDNILFQRADSVEAGWKAVQPFIDAWKKAGADGLKTYKAGSEGPEEANELLRRDGRSWRKLG
jgi:glucose-6-phosphate 1-dehydrogenase